MVHYLGGDSEDEMRVNDLIHADYREYQAITGRETLQGAEYSTGKLFQDVASDGAAEVLIKNPSDSGFHVLVFTRIITEAKFYTHKTVSPSVSDVGTEIPVIQRRSNTDRMTDTNAYESPTVDESSGAQFNDKNVGSGSAGSAVSGANVPTPEVLLAPGHDLYIVATNQTANSADCTIDVDFTEVPSKLIEELEG